MPALRISVEQIDDTGEPTGRDRRTFKLFLDLFSYFNITHGKLMKHLVGSTTVHRTIAPPGTRSPPDSIYTPID
jgi:hypothetical protein